MMTILSMFSLGLGKTEETVIPVCDVCESNKCTFHYDVMRIGNKILPCCKCSKV